MNIILTEKAKKYLIAYAIKELTVTNKESGMCWNINKIPSVRSGKGQIDYQIVDIDGTKIYISPIIKEVVYEAIIDVRTLIFIKKLYIREYKMK